jgi:magnesium transporter
MEQARKQRKKSPGLPPGTLIHVGEQKVQRVRITVLDYDEQSLQEKEVERVKDLLPLKETPTVTWINVSGIHDTRVLGDFGEHFDLHPLLLEDILNTEHRPKLQSYEEVIFVVLKMLSFEEKASEIRSEQVSLLLGPTFVVSFQESEGDVFDPVRQRIRSQKGRICRNGPDYLLYALIDAVVDHYFVVLEGIQGRLEALEEEVFRDPTLETLQAMQKAKRQLLFLRKLVWPLREVANGLLREEHALIGEGTEVFLRDVYDHTIQVIDTLESFRDTVSGLLDVYLSSLSNKMNEVMKVLTIIATIFIPLTFVAGIYGMNFEYMPELHLHWAYPAVWVLMALLAAVMILAFRKKGWF